MGYDYEGDEDTDERYPMCDRCGDNHYPVTGYGWCEACLGRMQDQNERDDRRAERKGHGELSK